MPYQQITIAVNDHLAERLADALMEHGALSAAIEDAYAGTEKEQAIFGEPGMPAEQIWQQSKVIALFGEHDEAAAVVKAAAQECGLKDLSYDSETLEDQDWVNNVQAHFYLPDGLPQGQFDVVVANILANPLRMLGEMLAARTKQGGRIVLSGLLAEQSEELGEIYSQWFDIEPAETEEGWARLSGVKR